MKWWGNSKDISILIHIFSDKSNKIYWRKYLAFKNCIQASVSLIFKGGEDIKKKMRNRAIYNRC
jgi:hypothetical protein